MRRLYSPLMASKPSPIAMIGTRMLSTSTNDSSALARRREQPQEQERVLRRGVADLLGGEIDHRAAEQHHQEFQHQHARAGQVVEQLAEEHHARAPPGRAFTLHAAWCCLHLLVLEVAVVDGVERRLLDREPAQARRRR